MNPLSYPQVLALSKGLNFFYIENNVPNPVTFSPIDSSILLSDSGILLAQKTSITQIKTWEKLAFIGRQTFGFGNPPKINGEYPSSYSIKKCNDPTIRNGFKFSYFDYFGDTDFFNRSTSEQGFFFSTEDGELAPEPWMQVEKNYVNNSHLVGNYVFTDTVNDIKPFDSSGAPTPIDSLNFHCINILALGNRQLATEDDGFFVSSCGGGDNFIFQKANGTIDTIGTRNSECDSFIFDPFNGPVFPSGRLNNIGSDYEDVKPANYVSRINSMEPYGYWSPTTVAPNSPITLTPLNWIFSGSPSQAETFRALDADIYTNAIQRCADPFSIDEAFPRFPYSRITGANENRFNDLGGLEGTLTILKNNISNYWEQGLAGTMVTSGQGGFSVDLRAITLSFLDSLSAKNQALSRFHNGVAPNAASLYDFVDTQRRAAPSPAGGFGSIKPIEFYKAPYFDFVEEKVKGSTKQRISCGFFTSLHITPSGLVDAPLNAYSSTDISSFNLDLVDLVRNKYSNREIGYFNPYLVDRSSATSLDLGFASGSFASTINSALSGQAVKRVSGYQNEITWIDEGNTAHYSGFNTNLSDVINGSEVVDIALNKNTNLSARRWVVKINSLGNIDVEDGLFGPSQLGDLVASKPQPSPTKGGFISIDAGFDHAIVLRSDGAAFAWGNNSFGQTSVPAGVFFKAIKAHGNFSCGITTNNQFRSWGSIVNTTSNVTDFWVSESCVIVKIENPSTTTRYSAFGNVPTFVTQFLNNSLGKEYLKIAFTGTYLIAEEAKKENYLITAGSGSGGITNVPSVSLFQDIRLLHAAQNYSLVVGETGIKAPLKEVYTKDTDEDGVDDVEVDYISIDQGSDVALVTIDSNGSARILYADYNSIGTAVSAGFNVLVYFGKDELINYLTDSNGNIPSIQNEGFVKATATGGYDRRPCVVWLLHETGDLYGIELTSSCNIDIRSKRFKTNPLDVNFGKFGNGIEMSLTPGYLPCYPVNTFQPSGGGSRLFIKHALNKIPKDSNGIRFPVVDIFGSYGTYGGCVCVNTKYTGTESELIPYQEPEIVFFPPVGCGWGKLQEDMLSKIQQRKVIFSSTGNATYIDNPDFNRDLYNEMFAIVEDNKGSEEIIYTPPRSVHYARSPGGAASAGSLVTTGSQFCIYSNNGNIVFIGSSKRFVDFTGPSNLNTFNSDLDTKKFTKTNASLLSNLGHQLFNRGTPDTTQSFLKPEFVNNPDELDTPVEFDFDTGVSKGGSIVIPGLDFTSSPTGFQTFFVDYSLTTAQDFNLDSSVGSVEKQLHNTGLKLLKKIK